LVARAERSLNILPSAIPTVGSNQTNMNSDIVSYYKDRAREYENVYSKPERQSDLLFAEQILQRTFADKDVYEIACGTGFWTQKICATAKKVFATDINDTVLEVARLKNYSPAKVDFQTADIFNLTNIDKQESLFGGFIWSHIKQQDLGKFINIANSLVKNGGTIVFIDNNYVEGSNLPVTDTDNFGNTYQTRTLENKTTHKVLKNFPTEIFIRQLLKDRATDINFINLKYYWILKYKNI
jgi:SAM-dependent methyltransferase